MVANDKFLPIVFVRGYAGSQSDVEQTVDDPFYGFNLGSTHIRQDQSGKPDPYFFESPLVRLIADHGYSEVFNGYHQEITPGCKDPYRTLWIHRYYDCKSLTYDNREPARLSVFQAAQDLAKVIDDIRQQIEAWVGEDGQPRLKAPKVNLVAHSMGGLVCRSLLEKVYTEAGEDPCNFVDKFFTYATPHGGIHFDFPGGSGLEKLRDVLGINDSDSFGPSKLHFFLTKDAVEESQVPSDFDPQQPNAFPADRTFCLVGTNAKDYEVALGLSRTAVGPKSDGLVQIESAWVRESHRAYVHRSHSGRYGIVNSEEGYLNLERFLFGDIKAKTVLCDLELFEDSPAAVHLEEDETLTYYVETRVALRALPVSMHERSLDHFCAVSLNKDQYTRQFKQEIPEQRPGLPLYTAFLRKDRGKQHASGMISLQYALRIAIHLEKFKKGRLFFADHVERLPLWTDYLVVEIHADGEKQTVISKWLSESPGGGNLATDGFQPLEPRPVANGETEIDFVMSLPASARALFGDKAALRIETFDWNRWLPAETKASILK